MLFFVHFTIGDVDDPSILGLTKIIFFRNVTKALSKVSFVPSCNLPSTCSTRHITTPDIGKVLPTNLDGNDHDDDDEDVSPQLKYANDGDDGEHTEHTWATPELHGLHTGCTRV